MTDVETGSHWSLEGDGDPRAAARGTPRGPGRILRRVARLVRLPPGAALYETPGGTARRRPRDLRVFPELTLAGPPGRHPPQDPAARERQPGGSLGGVVRPVSRGDAAHSGAGPRARLAWPDGGGDCHSHPGGDRARRRLTLRGGGRDPLPCLPGRRPELRAAGPPRAGGRAVRVSFCPRSSSWTGVEGSWTCSAGTRSAPSARPSRPS